MTNRSAAEDYKDTVKVVFRAVEIAQDKGHEFATLEHLLYALVENDSIVAVMNELQVDHAAIKQTLAKILDSGYISISHSMPRPTQSFDEVVTRAVGTAMFSQQRVSKPVDLLRFLTEYPHEDSHAVTLLLQAGLTAVKLKRYLAHGQTPTVRGQRQPAMGADGMAPTPEINSQEEAEKYLEQFCVNLNEQAKESKIDPLIGRLDEVLSIVQIVARRTKNNAVLVGEPGVGKTAIAEGLALKIVRNEVPEALKESVVYSLDVGNLVAGTRFRGDFEERVKLVLKSLTFIPHPILFIDEIHMVMGAGSGSQGSMDVANLLKPALAKGELRCIGSTTAEEFRKYFEKDRALLRRFKRVDVFEPSPEDTKLILRGLRVHYEDYHKVKFTEAALDAAVDLTSRYISNALLPDKAIDIIDSAGARQRIAAPEVRKPVIDVSEIEHEVSKVAKIPAQIVQEDEQHKLLRLESELIKNVVGQDRAQAVLNDTILMARAGLRDPDKPQGSYLFVGPTGVGKTETAKTLASVLGVPFIRYDMSEFMEKHTVATLIGSPPGYTGYTDGDAGSGKLINDINTHPYCVLLLDEIEKAHPDVFNILLQVMDHGSLSSLSGKKADFRNVILIMTSNAGAAEAEKNVIGIGRSSEDNDAVQNALTRMFTPEFRNRLDAVVTFNKLSPSNMRSIVDKFIRQLGELAGARNVVLEVSSEARDHLAKIGYDPAYGARPLARVISDEVKKALSRLMLFGDLKNGGTAYVHYVAGKIEVSSREFALEA